MKKLFISCPMKGRTEENIKKSVERMHKLAEIIFDEELEVIPSYIEDNPPEDSKQVIWYLDKSIQLLAEADYVIGIDYSEFYRDCNVERDIAYMYGIPFYGVNARQMFTDIEEIERKMWADAEKSCSPMPLEGSEDE